MRSHSSCLFHTGQSLLVDFGLCASTRLFFFTLVCRCWWTLACALPLVLSFLTLVSRCWWTLACALPLVLSFFTLVSRCWWTLACALPLVLSFSHWSVAVGGRWLVHFHSSCLFDTGQSLLVDFGLCAPTRLVFFDIGQTLLADFDLCAPTRLVFFDIGLSLLMNFGMCSPTRLVFLTLVSCCWWTLTCALPLVLSFSHWSVAVGGLWLVRFHSSFLFHTGLSLLVDFGLCASTRLVFFDIGQSLLVEFGLCAHTSLVFLIVVSYCWWTLTCALPLVLSF